MAWTDSDTVKKHLFDLDLHPTSFTDVKVHFDDNGDASLPHRGIVSQSETVKQLLTQTPVEQSGITLNGEAWVQLDYDDLLPDEIVVANDNGLQTIYQLDKDYAFDPSGGRLRRIEGGSISDGADVDAIYLRYKSFIRGADYSIDNSAGIITVLPNGDLEAETSVWVDYQVSAASGADQLIPEAITEAEDKILTKLKSEYDAQSQDQGLITGATELALSAVCRGLATRALSDGQTAGEGRARGWRDLAELYARQAWQTLTPFLDQPRLRSGDKRANQNWEWS